MSNVVCQVLHAQEGGREDGRNLLSGQHFCGCIGMCHNSGEELSGIYAPNIPEKNLENYLEYCSGFSDHPASDPNGLIAKAAMQGALSFDDWRP